MIEVPVHWDESHAQWHAYCAAIAGPADVVTTELGPGCTLHVDACTAQLLGITFVGSHNPNFARITQPSDRYHCFESSWLDGGVATTDDDTAALLARLAIGAAVAHETHGNTLPPAWQRELDDLARRAVRQGADAPFVGVEPESLTAAQRQFEALPRHIGRVVEEGRARVDPAWCMSDIVDLRSLRTRPGATSGVLELRARLRTQVYAAEAARILALLVEDQTDLVVAVAPFAVADRHDAAAHLVVGPGRDLADLSLAVVTNPAHRPSRSTRTAVAARDLAVRAAQAQRLGLHDRSNDLFAHSLRLWEALDCSPTPDAPAVMAPFAGEVDDLVTAFVHS